MNHQATQLPTILSVAMCCCMASVSASAAPESSDPPKVIQNFRLLDQHGNSHELYSYGPLYKGILLYTQGNGCPINRQSYPKMVELRDKFESQGIKFFFFNANPQDLREDVYKELTEFNIDIPCLLDPDQIVIGMLGSKRTCEAILIDPQNWEVKYRGAVDDRYDYVGRKAVPDNDWLNDALTAFLDGKPVSSETSQTKGCLINIYDLPQNVSYSQDVAPLIKEHCSNCHRKGGGATFALDSHAAAKKNIAGLKRALLTNSMPPWPADVEINTFANNHALDYDQKRLLLAWVNAGAPRDGDSDPLATVEPAPAPEWYLGKPDMVFEGKPDDPGEVFSYVQIDPGFEEDVWIRASEVLPNQTAAAGPVMAFAISPAGVASLYAAHRPGERPVSAPPGTGIRIAAGSQIYLRIPAKSEGGAKFGLYLLDERPQYEVDVTGVAIQDISIPPGEMNAEFSVTREIEKDSVLYALAPYMHGRGHATRVVANFPSGESETLLSVPDYNNQWPAIYWLQRPKTMPAGTKLEITAVFDNSARNSENPDPNQAVSFGIDEKQEVFAAFMALGPLAIEGVD